MEEPANTNAAPPRRRRRRELPWWVSASALAAFFAALGGLWHLGSLPKNGIHVEQVEADARTGLPPGSSRDDIVAWLVARGVTEYGDVMDPGGKKVGVRALIPNDSYLERAEIEIRCPLNGEGKLKEVSVTRSQVRLYSRD